MVLMAAVEAVAMVRGGHYAGKISDMIAPLLFLPLLESKFR